MGSTDTKRQVIERLLADDGYWHALIVYIDEKIEAALEGHPAAEDFFTRAGYLMERESRVKTLREIRAEFCALHDDAKAE